MSKKPRLMDVANVAATVVMAFAAVVSCNIAQNTQDVQSAIGQIAKLSRGNQTGSRRHGPTVPSDQAGGGLR